jgi:hypothetical protein
VHGGVTFDGKTGQQHNLKKYKYNAYYRQRQPCPHHNGKLAELYFLFCLQSVGFPAEANGMVYPASYWMGSTASARQ